MRSNAREAAKTNAPAEALPSFAAAATLKALGINTARAAQAAADSFRGVFAASHTLSRIPPGAPPLYVEAIKGGEAIASGAAAPSRASAEAILGSAVKTAKRALFAGVERESAAKRHPWSLKEAKSPTQAAAEAAAKPVPLPVSAVIDTGRAADSKLCVFFSAAERPHPRSRAHLTPTLSPCPHSP